jgi:hypothetical protein
MIEFAVHTDHPVALDSIDHTMPGGTMHDNSRNPKFNEKLFALLPKRPLWVMDLGCAGGGFVKDMLDAGQVAVGLEGSDYSTLWDGPSNDRRPGRRAEWATIPDNLFTCDVARPFRVLAKNPERPALFDVVTAWEVMEHLPAERLPQLCQNVVGHLADDGIWIMSVSEQQGPHHVTVKPKAWWLSLLGDNGLVHDQTLVSHFGRDWVRGPDQKAPESFHLILRRRT